MAIPWSSPVYTRPLNRGQPPQTPMSNTPNTQVCLIVNLQYYFKTCENFLDIKENLQVKKKLKIIQPLYVILMLFLLFQ